MSTNIDALMGSNIAAEAILKGKKDSPVRDTFSKLLDAKVEQEKEEVTRAPIEVTEVIRRIMPDGTIMVTKYNGSKIEERYRQAPVLSPTADGEASSASAIKLLGHII